MFWVYAALTLTTIVVFYKVVTRNDAATGEDNSTVALIFSIPIATMQGILFAVDGWVWNGLGFIVALVDGWVIFALWEARGVPVVGGIAPAPFLASAAIDSFCMIEFDYVDARGKKSRRSVDVSAVDAEYLEGFCHEAQATRTFVIGRVRGKVLDLLTGELLTPKRWAAQARKDPHNGVIIMGGD